MTSGIIHIVATPIGNLGDITNRAIEVLNNVDLILCEDTRVTRKLLTHFAIDTHTKSLHQHSTEKDFREIKELLEKGTTIALVSDAGTPAISDPGGLLLDYLFEHLPDFVVASAPGVSAVTTALSMSGFAADKFVFLGFPPQKNKRLQYFEQVASSEQTTVFYESPYRIEKALEQLASVIDPNRRVCVCRELTKKFESVYRGTITEVLAMNLPAKGEFVVVVEKERNK